MMQFLLVPGWEPAMACPACSLPLNDPVTLLPCQDLICRGCVRGAGRQCGSCSRPVEKVLPTSPIIHQLSSDVLVRCRDCKWQGTRHMSCGHVCADDGDAEPSSAREEEEEEEEELILLPPMTEEAISATAQLAVHFDAPPLMIEKDEIVVPLLDASSNNGQPWKQVGMSRNQWRALLMAYSEAILPRKMAMDLAGSTLTAEDIALRALAHPGGTKGQIKSLLVRLRYAQTENEADVIIELMTVAESDAPIRFETIASWLQRHAPRRKRESLLQEHAQRQLRSLEEEHRHFDDDVTDLPCSQWSYFGESATYESMLEHLNFCTF